MSNAQKHALARLRQRGKGVWRITFLVIGYDEEFLMFAPGEWSKEFAETATAQALAKKLKVKRKFIVHKDTKKEAP